MLKPRQFGRYILIDRISTGGMAEVYLAKSSGVEGFEKVVAIKRILPTVSEDPDFETMFIDEAKISARLAHSNVGQVFEFGQVDEQYYIAMEYIPGKDLRAIQTHLEETDRVMDVAMALHIISRLCQALDYAHRQKDAAGTSMEIIHRDISPPNVIVSFEGNVKLIDFGIAKATSRSTRTRAGKLKGKFAYMSPEQVQGMQIDHRSDIFSVGTLLHELLTNVRLFQGESQLAVMQAVRRAEVDPPSAINPEVPLEVDRITLKAVARDRDERYPWASGLRADIERFFARSSIVFDVPQLAAWMQHEFAGDVLAERKLRERLHAVKADEVSPLDDDMFDMEPVDSAAAHAAPEPPPPRSVVDATAADGPVMDDLEPGREALPTEQQPTLAGLEEDIPDGATVRHLLDTDRRTLDHDPERRDTDRSLPDAEPQRRDTQRSLPDAAGPSLDLETERRSLDPDTDQPELDTDRHTLSAPPVLADADLLVEEPEEADTDLAPPIVIGPSGHKVRQELVNWPTEYDDDEGPTLEPEEDSDELPTLEPEEHVTDLDPSLDAGPTRVEHAPLRLPRGPIAHAASDPIVPGPDRDGATVGGALEVDSNPDREMVRMPSAPAVDVAGIDGVVQTSEHRLRQQMAAHRGQISGTQELGDGPTKRFSSMHVIIIAAGLTLLIAGLIAVPMLVCNGGETRPPPAQASGTIIVTTNPPASCSVSLGVRPRGLLAPGDSLSLTGVAVGQHQVELVCGGFQSYSTVIEVHSAEVTFVEAPLKKE